MLLLYTKERSVNTQTKKVIKKTRHPPEKRIGEILCSIHWSSMESVSSCEDKNILYINFFKTSLDIIMPVKVIKVHANDPPWITAEFKKLIKTDSELFRIKTSSYIERAAIVLIKKEKGYEVISLKQKLIIRKKQLRPSSGKRLNGSLVWFLLQILKI